jgi:hypothetical protein
VTFTPSAPRKRSRWLALLAIVMLASSLLVTSAIAAPTFAWTPDDGGANDQPGQKDLTAQSSAFDGSTFYTAWKWDDTAWSGKNTGDACSLFDTDANGLVDYAVCVTVGTKSATELSTRVYSCKDTRSDRCTGAVLEGTDSSPGAWCSVASATGEFDTTDTQATCNASLIDSDLTGVSGLSNANLLNTCSYPSQEPNSDPSDCVLTIANVDVTASTSSGGSITWSATLTDTATLNPTTATGSVSFELYSDSTCTTLIWTSDADTSAPFASGSTGGTPSGGNVITDLTVNSTGVYYWIANYTPTGAFNGDSSACGEPTTIVATVTGSTGN